MSTFPALRPRRLRTSPVMRELVREHSLAASDFIYPLFLVPGQGQRRAVGSMPGVFQLSIDEAEREVVKLAELGLRAVMLFGLPPGKDEHASGAYDEHGIVQLAIPRLKAACPEMLVITDVCLCEYTSHGHCGVMRGEELLNDPTLELIARTALSHARAGADVVAPSDMMDGRVRAIRQALDGEAYSNVPILSYAVKYASGYYGPFREAADSAPAFGDRRSYQMDPANAREALKEAALDEAEGADMLMVKPALPYLDVLYRVRQATNLPLAAYHVSGEYAMTKAAAANGWIDEPRVVLESMLGVKRAGADLIVSYYAPEVAVWLKEGRLVGARGIAEMTRTARVGQLALLFLPAIAYAVGDWLVANWSLARAIDHALGPYAFNLSLLVGLAFGLGQLGLNYWRERRWSSYALQQLGLLLAFSLIPLRFGHYVGGVGIPLRVEYFGWSTFGLVGLGVAAIYAIDALAGGRLFLAFPERFAPESAARYREPAVRRVVVAIEGGFVAALALNNAFVLVGHRVLGGELYRLTLPFFSYAVWGLFLLFSTAYPRYLRRRNGLASAAGPLPEPPETTRRHRSWPSRPPAGPRHPRTAMASKRCGDRLEAMVDDNPGD